MNLIRGNHLHIRTAEGIRFRLTLASPAIRAIAWAVDLCVIGAITNILSMGLGFFAILSPDLYQGLFILCYFVISVGYSICLEWTLRGQTIGKKLMRLRVVDEEGLSLSFHQVALRNLLRVVDLLPGMYLVGCISTVLSPKCQRIGDYAAATIVIWNPPVTLPDLEQLGMEKYNSLRDYPHLCARLIQRITPEQAQIALQSLLRREKLEPSVRLSLFRDLAEKLKQMVPFPDEAVIGMTDEHYVRNVADVLFCPLESAAQGSSNSLARQN